MTQPANDPSEETILGIDYGDKRVGVARVNTLAKIPSPLEVLPNDEAIFGRINQIAKQENATKIVVGLPRNLSGEVTKQTKKIQVFADVLSRNTTLDIAFADETLSTKRARNYIKDQKMDQKLLDAVAACFILEEYMEQNI